MDMGLLTAEVEQLLQASRLHLAKGELHEAVGQATEVIRRDTKQTVAYLVRAEAHRRLKRPERALADLAVAIRLDPNQPGPYMIRAEILKRRNLFDQAIADATHALLLDPRNAGAFSIRAECRSSIGDMEGATDDVQEMIHIDPTRPVPNLEAKPVSGDNSPAMASDDERFWKQSGGADPKRHSDTFADGKPVDNTYRARRVVSDDDAPEALGVASGYKPETIGRPIPRMRGQSTKSLGNGAGPILILGAAVVAACSLWMVFRPGPGPEPSMKSATPQPSHVARTDVREETSVANLPVTQPVHNWVDDPQATIPAHPTTVATQPESTDDPLSSLRGTWLAFTEVADGKRISDQEMQKKQKTLRVVDDKFTLFTTNYRVVGKVRPVPRDGDNAIDLDGKFVEGGNGEKLLLRGIFEIKNNTLRLCYSVNNDRQVNERPTKSELEKERGGMCVSFRRTDPTRASTGPSIKGSGKQEGHTPVDPTDRDMKAIEGEWLCVAMEELGKTLNRKAVKEQDRRVTIKGHSYAMRRTENGNRHTLIGKFEIDASNGHFDFVGREQGGGATVWVGIYELKGDTLKLCYRYKRNDDAVRPTSFETDTDKPNVAVFYTFTRDKD
jgi:uncharacterized protein (TIGR03067 family)